VTFDVTPADSTSFKLRDDRPAAQRVSSAAPCELADDFLSPPAPQLLKVWLGRKLSAPLKGTTVVLTQFTVEVSEPGTDRPAHTTDEFIDDPIGRALGRLAIGGIEMLRGKK
jgi:hypothetical protein